MRVAFLSPLPPAATGIADYSAEVLGLLTTRHEIDVFHDQESVDPAQVPANCRVHRADTFLTRHAERAYDAAIYQMGNGEAHAFVYPLLERVPGLLVLHDIVLHHSRARTFLDSPDARAYAQAPWNAARRDAALASISGYEAELAHSYPAQAARLLEVQLGTVGDLLLYAYPLFRRPVQASRVIGVHNAFMASAVHDEVPDASVVSIPMPVSAALVSQPARDQTRARLGLAPDDFVVGCFGLMTREKRIETVARAVARASARLPQLRLLLVGPVPDRAELETLLARRGVLNRTQVAGRVPFSEIPAHLAAADVAVHLRYPTARETSAALLRLLAQGLPTVISDLEHLSDIPGDAVVRPDVTDEEGEVTRAILRLAARPEARARLGKRAAAFVAREHTGARTLDAYERALRQTLTVQFTLQR